MRGFFPYSTAAAITTAVGTVASMLGAAPAPFLHVAHPPHPLVQPQLVLGARPWAPSRAMAGVGTGGGPMPGGAAGSLALPAPGTPGAPGSQAGELGQATQAGQGAQSAQAAGAQAAQAAQTSQAAAAAAALAPAPGQNVLTPGFSAAQQVGTEGVPGVPSFTPGFGTTSPFGQTGMNQPGQPPFTEGFSGNQGAGGAMLNVPGQPDFYDGFGFNRGVVPPPQGASPVTPYPNFTTAPPPTTTVSPGPQGVGFYDGFGGGQPDFGFYAGFTTPR